MIVKRSQTISWPQERISGGGIHQSISFQICEMENEPNARAWTVARGEHSQSIENIGLDLTGNPHCWVFPTYTFPNSIFFLRDQHRFFEIGVVARGKRSSAIRVKRADRLRIKPMNLGQEWKNEPPAHYAAPWPGGRR
jgi:hypothetical protein